MRGVVLCAKHKRVLDANVRGLGIKVTPYRLKKDVSLRTAVRLVKNGLGMLCYLGGGKCRLDDFATSLATGLPLPLIKQWRSDEAKEAARKKKQREQRARQKRNRSGLDLRGATWTKAGVFLNNGPLKRKAKKSSRRR